MRDLAELPSPRRGRAEPVEIAARLDVAGERLGRHVRWRAASPGAGPQAEVDEDGSILAVDEEDIRRCDVAVDEPGRVDHRERAGDVGEQTPQGARLPGLRVAAAARDPF